MTFKSKIFWLRETDGSLVPVMKDERDEFGDKPPLRLATGMVLRYVDRAKQVGDFEIRVDKNGSVWARQRWWTKPSRWSRCRLSKTYKWVEVAPAIRPRGYSYVAATSDVFCAVKYR